jgi:hypothetical protein
LRFDFIEKQGKNNRHGKTKYETINTKQHGVAEKPEEVDSAEKILKMLKPYPGAAGHPPERVKILKRDKSAIHRHVVENKIINNSGKEKQIQGCITCGKNSFFSGISHPISFLIFCRGLKTKTVRKKTPGQP